MTEAAIQFGLFTAKTFIILFLVLLFFVTLLLIISKIKGKPKGRLIIKNLNKKYAETSELLLAETLDKKEFKNFLKSKKSAHKNESPRKNIYVLKFDGDIKASAVGSLSEEITAVLTIATPKDEVILRLESAGGVVHGYGLAAAQLMRLRSKHIPLTICIDKVAASGGYMMASIGNKILAAPFAIIGSIGVIVQLPNFHRLLKDKHIDFEQHTAGDFKRTITIFGENTPEGKEKLQEEIESIHQEFKNLISTYRKDLNIDEVATGEHWLGQQALALGLVDEIKTSDEYLMERSKDNTLYEVGYEIKKPLMNRLMASASLLKQKLITSSIGL